MLRELRTRTHVVVFCPADEYAQTSAYYTYYPESEAFVGAWQSDDAALVIDHMEGEQSLFRCVVTRLAEDGRTGTMWSYDNCAYDDIGMALSSFEVGVKSDISLDENG